MSFNSQLTNFISGSAGSLVAFTKVAEPITQTLPTDNSNAIIVTLVTVVGGLVSTLLTNLLKRLFAKKDKK